jgi:hypothetical protein
LATLLVRHIREVEPSTEVTTATGWLRDKEYCGGGVEWLATEKNWAFREGTILIVDEAQESYWDKGFWNIVKSMNSTSKCRIITFASYGSTGPFLEADTPGISPDHIVSLTPARTSVGLLLSKKEFDDFVSFRFIGESLLDSIFDLTNGHVGACEDLLEWIQVHSVSLSPRAL